MRRFLIAKVKRRKQLEELNNRRSINYRGMEEEEEEEEEEGGEEGEGEGEEGEG
jgi:hypothetical protein